MSESSNKHHLKKAGLKLTNARIKILKLFESGLKRHLSADDVYKKMLHTGEGIGIATVYRVLTQFVEADILCRHHFDVEYSVYELKKSKHHDHMLCIICNKVNEFVDEDIEKIQLSIAREKQFEITDHSLIIYGICRDCQKRQTIVS